MDSYSLVVESFTIYNTRARFDDTLWLAVSAFVDGSMVGTWSDRLGDFDNGTHFTPESVRNHPPVVINDPRSNVTFNFQLVNNNNVGPDVYNARAAATLDQLAGILAGGMAPAGWAALGSGFFWVGIGLEGVADLWSWLSADCDGPIAFDQVTGPRYWLDEQTDKNAGHRIRVTRNYTYHGPDLPGLCQAYNYDVTWSFNHDQTWMPVVDTEQTQLTSIAGVGAAAHNGVLHCFGVGAAGATATHAVTLAGALWQVDEIGDIEVATNLALSPVSFDDRLHVFGVAVDGTISALQYTTDGGAWYDEPGLPPPPELKTSQAIATVGFLDRLQVFARDQATSHLRVTSSSDLRLWAPWADVPAVGLAPQSAVAAAALDGTLHLFGIYDTGKKPAHVVVHTSTNDGHTWATWDIVEGGLPPESEPAAEPVDVTAGVHHHRVYVGARWQWTTGAQTKTAMALNFSGDGENWSGWRVPIVYDLEFQPSAPAALAAVHNHLYIISPGLAPDGDTTQVWAY